MGGNTLEPAGFKLVDGMMESYDETGLLWYTGRKFGYCNVHVVYKMRDKGVAALTLR